jgi:IS5 family transposase
MKQQTLGGFEKYGKTTKRTKSRVRARVEHTIGVIKRVFGFQKVRYRGLAKNPHRLEVKAARANLYMVRRRLLHA